MLDGSMEGGRQMPNMSEAEWNAAQAGLGKAADEAIRGTVNDMVAEEQLSGMQSIEDTGDTQEMPMAPPMEEQGDSAAM